jgi:hypothetical protein
MKEPGVTYRRYTAIAPNASEYMGIKRIILEKSYYKYFGKAVKKEKELFSKLLSYSYHKNASVSIHFRFRFKKTNIKLTFGRQNKNNSFIIYLLAFQVLFFQMNFNGNKTYEIRVNFFKLLDFFFFPFRYGLYRFLFPGTYYK